MDYFEDGSIDLAVPPLHALLHIMAYGTYEGKTIGSPEIRELFSKDHVINSTWYYERLVNKQKIDVALLSKKIEHLKQFVNNPVNHLIIHTFGYSDALDAALCKLADYTSKDYIRSLKGTLGANHLV